MRNIRAGHLRFEDGDFLVGVVDEFLNYFMDDSISPSRRAEKARSDIIRQIADQAGAQESTLADSESMARKFPPAVREKWEVLTFHQLRACAAAKQDWERWAAWAVAYGDEHGGKVAPVRVIRREIKREGGGGYANWERWTDKMLDLAEKILDEGGAPTQVIEVTRGWYENVQKIKDESKETGNCFVR